MKGNRIVGCGIVVSVLIVVLVVAAVLAITRPARMVRAEIARIKAEGAPLTMKDLDGPKIPDSQNGAVIYQKAFALVSTKDAKKDMAFIARMASMAHPIKTEAEWKELRRVLAKYDGVVPLVRQAASRPECRFPVGWEKSGALEAGFTHLPALRDLSRVLYAKAMVCARDGKPGEAARYIDLGFALTDAMKYHPTLIVFYIRCDQISMFSYALRNVLNSGNLSAEDARLLMHRLARIDLAGSLGQALEVERATGIWTVDQMRPAHGAASPIWSIRCDLDEQYFLTKMRQFIKYSSLPYRDVAGTDKLTGPVDIPKYAAMSALCLPIVWHGPMDRDRSQSWVSGSRIALALGLYHDRHKAYPANLDEVAGLLGGKLPIDPFSGKAFVYTRQGPGCLLYSIGPDLKDNGGKEPPPGKNLTDGGDIVWRMK